MTLPLVAIPSSIHIYHDDREGCLDCGEVAAYLRRLIKSAEVDLRPDFFRFCLDSEGGVNGETLLKTIAVRLAASKLREVTRKDAFMEPMQGEVDFEMRNLKKASRKTFGLVYEGYRLQQLYGDFITRGEKNERHLHLIFTSQLFATWDENDCRYHARVGVFGFPSLISTSGVVEAPARPRDYYLKRQLGEEEQTLRELYGRFYLEYNDQRMTDVMKGYAAQALFYYLVGFPFCDDNNCRLFNAHFQSEVLLAQGNTPYEFCPRHQGVLDRLA